MQWLSPGMSPQPLSSGPLVLVFERNDAVAVPLLGQLRMAGYDVRAARIPVEVFDLMQREPVDLIVIDLGNAAANRREFWVGLDSQRRNRTIHVITFRYMATGDTGNLEEGLRVARADVEIVSANGFGPLIEAVRARLPGATPLPTIHDGPPANLHLPPIGMQPSVSYQTPPTPLPPQNWSPLNNGNNNNTQDIFRESVGDGADAASPFEQPYSSNPFKRGNDNQPSSPRMPEPAPQSDPFGPFTPLPQRQNWGAQVPAAWNEPQQPVTPSKPDTFTAFSGGGATPQQNGHVNTWGVGNDRVARGSRPQRDAAIDDAWTPPDPTPPRRGIAYRGYDDEPLAPDDPRIEDQTSPVPAVVFNGQNGLEAVRNERALSTILMDSAVIAPQRLDALRSIQLTLSNVGIDFGISELAMLFKFLNPDQLLAALLVSRGIVTAEEIASLGRIKQELLLAGKDYDLETLLVMFNVLPADEVQALRQELA